MTGYAFGELWSPNDHEKTAYVINGTWSSAWTSFGPRGGERGEGFKTKGKYYLLTKHSRKFKRIEKKKWHQKLIDSWSTQFFIYIRLLCFLTSSHHMQTSWFAVRVKDRNPAFRANDEISLLEIRSLATSEIITKGFLTLKYEYFFLAPHIYTIHERHKGPFGHSSLIQVKYYDG